MEKALEVKLDWQNVKIITGEGSLDSYRRLYARWRDISAQYNPILRRWP